ncbi:MAG: DEAD/DEAH box helicase [Candidatus Atribacteria bacterium]|nr:MAG: DEAD/DEAH box helicase [Candidatus Atribacteria bacterium]
MEFSWSELGLARVWMEGATSCHLYDLEKGKKVAALPPDDVRLRVSFEAESGAVLHDRTISLSLLSRVLLPTLVEHTMESVCAHFGIEKQGSETKRLARLLEALLSEAVSLDREVVALVAQLLPSPIAEVLMGILVIPRPAVPEARVLAGRGGEDVGPEEVAVPSAQAALAANGPIASSFGTFEVRTGQLHMAEAIDHAFRHGHAALVEAGPGTGKTFAYLIPAILHLQKNPSDRVLVSTRTRQLQEQLYGKDLPFLVKRLMPDLEVALLKGRENYLCLRRWHALIGELTESLEQDILLPLLAPLVRWIVETQTGDIEENSAFQSDPEARRLWRRLCDSPHHCTGAFCQHCEECFSVLARRRARRADLVVVNHSLLLGDLAVDNVVLGKYTHLVVDEAHTLESVARMAFTRQLTERAFVRLADDLAPSGRRRGWLQRTPFVGGIEPSQRIGDLLSRLRKQVVTVFKQLDENLPDERRADFSALTELSDEIGEMPILLTQLESALDSLSDHIEDEEPLKELEGFIRIVQGLRDVVSAMSIPPSENTVHWFERSPHTLAFHATPMDVAPFLEQLLYPRLKSLVLTSATLSLAGSFEYICRSIGLTDDAFAISSMIAESPFAYEDRMRILVPRYIPPAHGELPSYALALATLIASLSERTGKNGLALFTSYAMMQAVKEMLPAHVNTLVQGELSRRALIDQFRSADRPMWLLGTESFWEGVDFPGEELEILLISRLPFPVPTDPVLAAMGDRMMRTGRDPFMELSLPLAGMKLRQGIGRLIRTTGDRGLVFLTDQRIVTRGYGKLLAKSLPVKIETMADANTLLSEAVSWFDSSS